MSILINEYVLVHSIHIYRAPTMSKNGTCADRDQESQKELTLTELRAKMLLMWAWTIRVL